MLSETECTRGNAEIFGEIAGDLVHVSERERLDFRKLQVHTAFFSKRKRRKKNRAIRIENCGEFYIKFVLRA